MAPNCPEVFDTFRRLSPLDEKKEPSLPHTAGLRIAPGNRKDNLIVHILCMNPFSIINY